MRQQKKKIIPVQILMIDGKAQIGDISMKPKEGLEITDENIIIKATSDVHCMILDMAFDDTKYKNNMKLIDRTRNRYDNYLKRLDKAKVEPRIK